MKHSALVLVILAICSGLAQNPQTATTNIPLDPTQTPLGQKAQVDWSSGQLVVTGSGVAPAGFSEAQARVRSLGAARADAQRLLVSALSMVQVDAETTVKNYELHDDTVRTRISGLLRGATVVEGSEIVEKLRDGSFIVRVQMAVPLYGAGGLAAIVYPEVAQRREQPAQGQPTQPAQGQPTQPAQGQPIQPAQGQPNTSVSQGGLIIDVRGKGFLPCMAPKLLSEDGSEVWGTVVVSSQLANDIGIAAFVRQLEEATRLLDRGAPNQMRVTASAATGAAKCNAVISRQDAARIKAANAASDFLGQFKVTFVY